MTVHVTSPRRAGKSSGAAIGGALLTLGMFVVLFLSFLIAPLLLLAAAYLAYLAMRPRANRGGAPAAAPGTPAASGSAHGFGSGAR
ncbi:hypothetical protein [Nocardioides sp.]|uniref:hypothetical protein n=1 Tax=Nocardioides sp. TaxID=35761 RepID=UPI003516CA32